MSKICEYLDCNNIAKTEHKTVSLVQNRLGSEINFFLCENHAQIFREIIFNYSKYSKLYKDFILKLKENGTNI